MTTRIPKQSLLEQCINFIPLTKIPVTNFYFKCELIQEEEAVNEDEGDLVESGDPVLVIAASSSKLFNYLCPLRIMRITCDEDLLLFFLQAPTIGFALKMDFHPKHFRCYEAFTNKKNVAPGVLERYKEKTLRCLRKIGQKAKYLTQLYLTEIDLLESKTVVVTDLLPNLKRLEILHLIDFVSRSEFSVKAIFPIDSNPRVESSLSTMLTRGSAATLEQFFIDVVHNYSAQREIGVILSQTNPARFQQLRLRGHGGAWGNFDSALSATTMNIVAHHCPRLSHLLLEGACIDDGFFASFFKFKGLKTLKIHPGGKFKSKNPLEYQQISKHHSNTLESLQIGINAADSKIQKKLMENFFFVLIETPSANSLVVHQLSEVFIFPRLTSLEFNCKLSSKALLCLTHDVLPSIQSLIISYTVRNFQEEDDDEEDSCVSVQFLLNLSELVTLRILKIALVSAPVKCSNVNQLDDALNEFGENLGLLEELLFLVEYKGLSDDDLKNGLSFAGWENLKNIKKLHNTFINKNLASVIAQNWTNLTEIFFPLIYASVSKNLFKFFDDACLLELAEIGKHISTRQSASCVLNQIGMANIDGISDVGMSKFIEKFTLNATESNPALSQIVVGREDHDDGDGGKKIPRHVFVGIKSFCFYGSKLGIETCRALAKYCPNLKELNLKKSNPVFDPTCLQPISQMVNLDSLAIAAVPGLTLEHFVPIAKNLLRLDFLDLDGTYFYKCGTDSTTKQVKKVFAEQVKKNDLYVSNW